MLYTRDIGVSKLRIIMKSPSSRIAWEIVNELLKQRGEEERNSSVMDCLHRRYGKNRVFKGLCATHDLTQI